MDTAKLPGNLFLIVAPSGAGKSSLVTALLGKDQSLALSISCTTRAPRPGEEHGRHYFFVDELEFNQLRDGGGLLEWAHVHGNFYGTPRRYIEDQLAQGIDIVLEIDWQGARQVREIYPEAIDIFILPPSLETLEKRLNERGQDDQATICKRLQGAHEEIIHAPECRYIVINEVFESALRQIECIIQAARLSARAQHIRHGKLFLQLGIPSCND